MGLPNLKAGNVKYELFVKVVRVREIDLGVIQSVRIHTELV